MSEQRRTYREGEEFPGRIGRTFADSEPAWIAPAPIPEGAPNVVVILFDDLGFGQLGCFGGLGGRISTPNLDRLAQSGLRYNNFHVAPMCSPTRAALLTGRNPHTVGVGMIMEMGAGYPGYDGHLSKYTAMIPAILSENGYTSSAVGKWHLVPPAEVGPAGPMDRWPLRQGFDRFYGFMSALADQYSPSIWVDNHHIGFPEPDPEKHYHLTEDLVDQAIGWVDEIQAVSPERPFFHYIAPGAMHQPHQVAEEWSDRYRGAFSAGWDVIREETLARQKELGVVPPDTELPPRNPGVPEWDSFTAEEKALLEREMEVFAGFLEHTDAQIGRYLDALAERDILDDTLVFVMSDNGASGEGTTMGESHHVPRFNGSPESREDKLAAKDCWGGRGTSSNYATGWAMAGNTPNRWYKQFTHEGGTRSPLIVHWTNGIESGGDVRTQFHHVTDIVPTILESTGSSMGETVRGYAQEPLEGVSMAYGFDAPDAPTRKKAQYFEMLGHRAIWADGWKAVTAHMTEHTQLLFMRGQELPLHDGDFDNEPWELYHLDEDYSEMRDLADEHPERLAALVDRWWREAEKHNVLPLDDRFLERYKDNRRAFGSRNVFEYRTPVMLPALGSPNLRDADHTIVVEVTVPAGGCSGAIVSDGANTGGWALGVVDGRVTFGANWLGRTRTTQMDGELGSGRRTITVTFTGDPDSDSGGGVYRVESDGQSSELRVDGRNRVRYDSTGVGLRVGRDTWGVVPEFAAPAVFTGAIERVRITRDGAGAPADPEAETARDLANAVSEQ